jgi:hypothetical protein
MYSEFLELKHKNSVFTLEKVFVYNKKAFQKQLKPFAPNNGDKIYFTKDVTIPFAKLKDFMISHNVKRTTDIDKADTVVLSNDFLYEYTSSAFWHIAKREELINQIETGNNDVQSELGHLLETLNNSEAFYIIFDNSTWNALTNYNCHYRLDFETGDWKKLYIFYNPDHVSDLISNKTLVHELSILKNINGDEATVITDELYLQLDQIIQSSDTDNLIVAMEIMANCKYVESLPYLLVLFKKHCHSFYYSSTKNHINFKALRTFIGHLDSSLEIEVDAMLNVLIQYKQLTEENLNIIFDKIYMEYDIVHTRNSGRYNIKSLEFSEITLNDDRVTEILGKQYKYQIKKWQ